MTLFNYALDNGLLFYTGFAGMGIAITWSFVRQVFFNPISDQITVETPSTDTGVDTLRALSSSTVQPSPTIHQFSLDQLRFIENHKDVGVQANILPDGTSIETTLQVLSENINNLQLKLDYLLQA